MHVIVTRPEPDAADFIHRLEQLGHTASAAPLLSMRPTGVPLALNDVQAVIATSRNALRAIAASLTDDLRARRLFVVGPASARLAKGLGFTNVIAGEQGARELAELIGQSCRAGVGAILYLSGDEVAFDMTSALSAQGFDVRHQVVYETVAADALPETVASAIKRGNADAVVLMSPRTAKLFVQLTADAGLAEKRGQIAHLCMSPAVAAALGDGAQRILIAKRPSSEEMLALVKEMASKYR